MSSQFPLQRQHYGMAAAALVNVLLVLLTLTFLSGLPQVIGLLGCSAVMIMLWLNHQARQPIAALPSHPLSPEKLRLALAATSIAVWEWQILTNDVTWVSSPEQPGGAPFSNFAGTYEEFLNCIHPDDRDSFADAMAEALATQQHYQQDFRIVVDQTIAWMALESQLIADPLGRVVRVIGVTTNITERKRAEIVLQQQTERERLIILITQRLRRSLDLADILSTTVAEVREFLQADRVIIYQFNSDWSGTVLVESVTEPWYPIAGVTVRDPHFGEQFAQFYQQGGITAVTDIHTAGLDPHYLATLSHLQVQSILILPISQGTSLWGLLAVHQCIQTRHWEASDINLLRKLANQLAIAVHQSELHRQVQELNNTLEQQVKERTAQLQQALDFEAVLRRITEKVRDSLDEAHIWQTAVHELSLALSVENCNAALYDLAQKTSTIRYEASQTQSGIQGMVLQMAQLPEIYQPLLKGQILEYCPLPWDAKPLAVVKLACPILVRSTLSPSYEEVLGDLWLTRPADQTFNAQETRLVQQVANQCAIALRQARLYQAAQAQVQELERLNRLKDDFLSTVSHELRTPMASIKMAIQMLELALQPLQILDESDKATRYFQILKHESEREIKLINDLLDLSRLEAGTEPLVISRVDLNNWIAYILESFQERTQNQQQVLQISIAPDLCPVETDLNYLERILTELLQNACKYTPPGETIQVSATPDHQGVRLSVRNSGVEIPPTERDRIFEKFYRIPNNDPWKHGGTGLGLALVKRLAESLGATITSESGPSWTEFILHIPCHVNPKSPRTRQSSFNH